MPKPHPSHPLLGHTAVRPAWDTLPEPVRRVIAARLPAAAPVPRLRWHGAAADWTVLVFDDIAGRHPDLAPGSASTSDVVAAIAAMGRELTPCPVPELQPSTTARGNWLHGWELIAQNPTYDLGAWEGRHVAELAEAETVWRSHADGPTLVHGDIRPDNLLTTPSGRVIVVDWAHASRGAAWQDVADLVPHLRAYQRRAAGAALAWVRHRSGAG